MKVKGGLIPPYLVALTKLAMFFYVRGYSLDFVFWVVSTCEPVIDSLFADTEYICHFTRGDVQRNAQPPKQDT